MRRKRPSVTHFFWRSRRSRQDALSPLLSAVRSETPPEGLLQSIERELEEIPVNRARGSNGPRGYPAISIAAAACIGIAVMFLELVPGESTTLIDPTGRAVAQIHKQNGDARVRLLSGSVAGDAEKSWHLWGIVSAEAGPVHIGALTDAGLAIRNPARFLGYAISMEDRSFSGDRPVGPVLALTTEN